MQTKCLIGLSAMSVKNRILLSLPESEYAMLQPFLTFKYLSHQEALHSPNRAMQYVYCVKTGLVSVLIETRDGKTVEVDGVGNNGVVGLPSTFGLGRNPLREIV